MSRALRARGATRLLARRLDLDTLDNDERDHSTSASACHHVQWMDARNVESKVRAACPKAARAEGAALLLGGGGRGDALFSRGVAGEA